MIKRYVIWLPDKLEYHCDWGWDKTDPKYAAEYHHKAYAFKAMVNLENAELRMNLYDDNLNYLDTVALDHDSIQRDK